MLNNERPYFSRFKQRVTDVCVTSSQYTMGSIYVKTKLGTNSCCWYSNTHWILHHTSCIDNQTKCMITPTPMSQGDQHEIVLKGTGGKCQSDRSETLSVCVVCSVTDHNPHAVPRHTRTQMLILRSSVCTDTRSNSVSYVYVRHKQTTLSSSSLTDNAPGR